MTFLSDCRKELKRVEWPEWESKKNKRGEKEGKEGVKETALMAGTTSLLFAGFLYVIDIVILQLFSWIVYQ
jgi:preprotein translocase subunit SecE